MTSKADFTEDEWALVVRAPFQVGMAVSLADPGGPIEATKETMATLKGSTNPPTREQLLADVALDIQSITQQRQNPLGGYRTPGSRRRERRREHRSACPRVFPRPWASG